MDNLEKGSLKWLKYLGDLNVQLGITPDASNSELARVLKLHRDVVINLKILRPALDPATIEKIRQSTQSDPPYTLSYNSVKALADLDGRVPDLVGAVHTALDQALSRRLTTLPIEGLVEWMVGGKPVGDFDPSKVKRRKKKIKPLKLADSSQPFENLRALSPSNGSTVGRENQPLTQSHEDTKKDEKMGTVESLFWGELAGISMVSRIKAKLKKGEKPTLFEAMILAVSNLLVPIKFLVHQVWRAMRFVGEHVFGFTNRVFRKSFGIVGGWGEALLGLALAIGLCVLLVWALWNYFANHLSISGEVKRVLSWPLHWIGEKVTVKTIEPQSTQIAQGTAQSNQDLGLNQPNSAHRSAESMTTGTKKSEESVIRTEEKSKSPTLAMDSTGSPRKGGQGGFSSSQGTPKTLVQPWNPNDEEKGMLDSELESVPEYSTIKAIVLVLDIMSGDMATKRMGDLTNFESYALMTGHDRQRITSVAPALSGLTVTYGGGLPFGGPTEVKFYWEDVKAIHCYEIKVGKDPSKARTLYQYGLVVNGLKRPFIVQCDTAGNLRHQVSTIQFWIGAAGNGRKAPIAGLPYLNQGLWLDEKCRVKLVWADSPAGQAGIQPGEGVWSWDVDTKGPEGKPFLDGALQSPVPGKHSLYVSTAEEWGSGPPLTYVNPGLPFKPKRVKTELLIP